MIKFTKFLKCHKTRFSSLFSQDITYKIRHPHSNINQFEQEVISALDKLKVTKKAGSITDIKSKLEISLILDPSLILDGVIFFKNINDEPIGYKSLIKTPDNARAIVFSLNEGISSALLVDNTEYYHFLYSYRKPFFLV